MAPIVAKSFLPIVRDLLSEAYTGWGIDWLMPYLLLYPKDKLAVIDKACMIHPREGEGKSTRPRLYDVPMPISRWGIMYSVPQPS